VVFEKVTIRFSTSCTFYSLQLHKEMAVIIYLINCDSNADS